MKKVLIFALSLCFVATAIQAQAPKDGEKGKEKMKARFEQMKTDLKLTDEQAAKIKDLFTAQGEQMKAIRESGEVNREKMKDLMKEREAKMKEILTPEQFAKLKEMRKNDRKDRPEGRPEGRKDHDDAK